jgi:hypothetical protein
MLEAIADVATDSIARAGARQILRDEHLHAAFGWEALADPWPRLDRPGSASLQRGVARAFAGFEASAARGIGVADVAGREIEIARGEPNLGTLSDLQYATIFYATVEQEILPKLEAIGIDGQQAWAERGG